MNFIKSVAGKLDDPMQNAKLDKINDRRVDQYDREIDELIHNQHHMYTPEEVAHLEQGVIDHCLNDYDKEAVPYIGRAVHENWREGGGENLEVRKRMLLRELEKRRGRLGAAVTEVNNRTRAELEGYFQRIGQSEGIIQESLPTDFGTIVNHYSHLKNELAGAITAHHHQGYDHYDTFVHHQLGNALRDAQNRTVDSNRAKHHEREVDALAQSLSRLHTAEEAEDLERLVVDNTFRAWGEETAGGLNIDDRREVLGNRLQEKRGIITNAVNETNARIRSHLDGYVAHINTAEEQIKATLPTEVEKIENHFNELRQQLEALIVPTYNGGFDQFNAAVHNELQLAVDAHRERVTAENDRLRQQALEGYVAHINAYEEQIKASFPTDSETIDNHFNELRQQLQSQIVDHFSGGYDQFNAAVNNELQVAVDALRERVTAENERVRQEAIADLRAKTFAAFAENVRAQIQQIAGTSKENLGNENASSKIFTSDVLDGLNKDLDDLAQRYLDTVSSITP